MNTSNYQQGDVVLVDFPFPDASGSKIRPAVIMSTEIGHHDVIVVAITSQRPSSRCETDYFLEDWISEGLNEPSWIRSRVSTIHRSLILQRIGRLTDKDLKGVKRCLSRALGLD
ncbi:MAG: type II toxin-antitoxin system PemK/MazF family toxin [Candidatus Methanosuratincola sp.]